MNVLKYLESKGIKDNPRIIDVTGQATDFYLQTLLEDFKKQLTLTDVVVELPSKKSKEFERWTQSKGYEPAFNGLWYEKNNQTYNTDLLHRAFTNEIEFGN
tara:strand:+ start:48 stop:350 length:303 start_codon:yes stop_codon:yes gene_type:complete